MIVAFVTANLFSAGVSFLTAAAIYYNAGRRDARAARLRQRAHSATARARLAALAVQTTVHIAPLPRAKQDHGDVTLISLRPTHRGALGRK